MQEKSCPFCGGPAYQRNKYKKHSKRYYVFYQCFRCGARGPIITTDDPDSYATSAKVTKAWNGRVDDE